MASEKYPLGLQREGLIKIILEKLKKDPEISSKQLNVIRKMEKIIKEKYLKEVNVQFI